MEKYAKKLQDIINEQDFCFEPEEARTVEKALGVLKKYEDANIPAEACAEYRKFEDELIRDGMSLQHVFDLLKACLLYTSSLSARTAGNRIWSGGMETVSFRASTAARRSR